MNIWRQQELFDVCVDTQEQQKVKASVDVMCFQ